MLPRINRLSSVNDFRRLKETGNILQSQDFGVLYQTNGNLLNRFGFIVSTKISKKAVIRNKIKRMFRQAVRIYLNILPSGFDVLFLARKQLVSVLQPDVDTQVKTIFEKIASQQ